MKKSFKGIISSVFGAYYMIRDLDSPEREIQATLRGKLRLEKNKPEYTSYRHLFMVGDHVTYLLNEEGEGIIESFFPRSNQLLRATGYEVHALGGNLDRAVLVQSLNSPVPKTGFIDRFLASCSAGKVEPVIFFTKPDLADKIESDKLTQLYMDLGYRVFVSNITSNDEANQNTIEQFRKLTLTGTTLFAGNSGTGKSTIINKIFHRDVQKTSEISDSTNKGRHTTTNSSLFVSEIEGAFFIDTPGVKEWGIQHLESDDIYKSFPEFKDALGNCEFRNCDHSNGSRGCRIRDIINEARSDPASSGRLTAGRLKSLESMLDSLTYKDKIKTGDYIKGTGRIKTGKLIQKKKQ